MHFLLQGRKEAEEKANLLKNRVNYLTNSLNTTVNNNKSALHYTDELLRIRRRFQVD